jgi:hypothetical protein
LQHGVEVAARCATVNKTVCASASEIQSVAAREAYGLGLGPETFSFSATTCGNEVSANYSYRFAAGRIAFAGSNGPAVGLTARSCFPKQ